MIVLRRGSKGVGLLHQALVEAGYEVAPKELLSGDFGESTEEQVRSFQASHVGQKGKPLDSDGMVGPETSWALSHRSGELGQRATVDGWRCEPSQVREQVRRVLEVGIGELGVAEIPGKPNQGPRVDMYTAPRLGIPWCAAFASWCFSRGVDSGSPFGRIDSTWGLYEWALRKGRVIMSSHPDLNQMHGGAILPGDIFLVLRGARADSANRRGHTGIICHILKDDQFCTIAGNESDCVRGGIRSRSLVSAIIRPVPLVG